MEPYETKCDQLLAFGKAYLALASAFCLVIFISHSAAARLAIRDMRRAFGFAAKKQADFAWQAAEQARSDTALVSHAVRAAAQVASTAAENRKHAIERAVAQAKPPVQQFMHAGMATLRAMGGFAENEVPFEQSAAALRTNLIRLGSAFSGAAIRAGTQSIDYASGKLLASRAEQAPLVRQSAQDRNRRPRYAYGPDMPPPKISRETGPSVSAAPQPGRMAAGSKPVPERRTALSHARIPGLPWRGAQFLGCQLPGLHCRRVFIGRRPFLPHRNSISLHRNRHRKPL